MATAAEMLSIDITSVMLVPLLQLSDLSRLESVCTGSLRAIVNSNQWTAVACHGVAQVDMVRVLEEKPSRQELKRLIGDIRGLTFVDRFPTLLDSLKQSQKMVQVARNAEKMALTHLTSGGQAESVFVGCFRFPDAKKTGDSDDPHTLMSDPVKTRLTWKSELGRRVVYIKLILFKGNMYLSAKVQGMAATTTPPRLLIDVHALSESTILQMRKVNVSPDGSSVKNGSGIYMPKGSDAQVRASLAAGLNCVIFVRDAPESVVPQRHLSDALCLDRLR